MSTAIPVRPELAALGVYQSPQLAAPVRLNTNESAYPPPDAWQRDLAGAIARHEFHRYPDRHATELRQGIAALHGVGIEQVFCANGSNEVLQCLLLAFGGHGRTALVFEPTYAMHSHIARLTATTVAYGRRGPDLRIDIEDAADTIERVAPDIVFVCSPNNPTGRMEEAALVERIVDLAPGLVVVDEAYGQFAGWSALSLRTGEPAGASGARAGLAVVETFSKTWAMAGARLGYVVADEAVVEGCLAAALPYHLSAQTQLAGILALSHGREVAARLERVVAERARLASGLAALPVQQWPSDANFILFRPAPGSPAAPEGARPDWLWHALLAEGVLVRDFSSKPGLEGCLRVTVGSPEENDRFLDALGRCLGSR